MRHGGGRELEAYGDLSVEVGDQSTRTLKSTVTRKSANRQIGGVASMAACGRHRPLQARHVGATDSYIRG